MVVNELEFMLSATGVVLNADSVLPYVDIIHVSGLDSQEFRETIRDHEGVDGGYMDAEFEKGRDIILEGVVYADSATAEVYLDALKANFAPSTVPIPFYIYPPGVGERVIFVKPRGVRYDWEQLRRLGITQAQFLMYAEDPRVYTNLLQAVTIAFGGPATTGFGFNLGFNLSFGATVPVTGGTVVVGGNRPVPAIMTISGPVTNPRIINVTDSKSLDFIIELGALDTLSIDLANRTVTLNGNINRRNALQEPNWWLFNSGSTFVVFGGGAGTGTVLIEYRDAWR